MCLAAHTMLPKGGGPPSRVVSLRGDFTTIYAFRVKRIFTWLWRAWGAAGAEFRLDGPPRARFSPLRGARRPALVAQLACPVPATALDTPIVP